MDKACNYGSGVAELLLLADLEAAPDRSGLLRDLLAGCAVRTAGGHRPDREEALSPASRTDETRERRNVQPGLLDHRGEAAGPGPGSRAAPRPRVRLRELGGAMAAAASAVIDNDDELLE